MIHGLVLVDKAKNLTSHAVVDEIRKIFKIKKVGHFGTLDPLAEGLLLIGLGNATKFFNFYIGKRKRYSGRVKFGYATTTYDSEGEPLAEKKEIDLYQVDIPALLSRFTGALMQSPPIYSAKKYKGKPLYKYARENKEAEVEVKPAPVEVYSLKGNVIDKETLCFEAITSSGTYVRSLAHDMGEVLEVGAFLEALKREEVGEFQLKDAFSLEEIARYVAAAELTRVVVPIEMLLPEFPRIVANQGGRTAVLNGQPLLAREIMKVFPIENSQSEHFRIFDDEGKLLAIAQKDEKIMRFKPTIVFSN